MLPIFRARQWTLQNRTRVALKADPLNALTGDYLWVRRNLPSSRFYEALQGRLLELRRQLDTQVPRTAAGNFEAGRDRVLLAEKLFNFQSTFRVLDGHPSKFVYQAFLIALVFGVSALDTPDTADLFDVVAQVDLATVWPAAGVDNYRSWLRSVVQKAARMVSTTEAGATYMTLRGMMAINFTLGAGLANPEYALLQEESPYGNTYELAVSTPDDSFTVLCYQRGRIAGNQVLYPTVNGYFSDDEYLTLRRVDSIVVLPKDLRVVEQTFAYMEPADVPKDTLAYRPDNLSLPRELVRFKPVIDAESVANDAVERLPRQEKIPFRHTGNIGLYAYALTATAPVNWIVGGLLPVPIEVTLGDALVATRKPLNEWTLPFTNVITGVFSLQITNRVSRQFTALRVNPQLDFTQFFPKGLPAGAEIAWSKHREGKTQEFPELFERLTYSPVDRTEEIAGLYQLDVRAPNGFNEVLLIDLDYKLLCKRCDTHYTASTNSHGECTFHSSHPGEYATAFENSRQTMDEALKMMQRPEFREISFNVINAFLRETYAPISDNVYANAVAQRLIPGQEMPLQEVLPLSWLLEILFDGGFEEFQGPSYRILSVMRENLNLLKNWLRTRNFVDRGTWNGIQAWFVDGVFDLDLYMELVTLNDLKRIPVKNNQERKWLESLTTGYDAEPGLAVRRFVAEENVDEATAVLEGARSLNPNIYSGVATSSLPGSECRYVCCRRSVHEPGCYVGRHNSETAVPDLSDLMNGRRGTEWQLDRDTNSDSYNKISDLYAQKLTTAGTQAELKFNRVHGGLLMPDLGLKPADQELLEKLLQDETRDTEAYLALFDKVDWSRPFRRWTQSREAQLEYGQVVQLELDPDRITRSMQLFDVFRSMQSVTGANEPQTRGLRLAILNTWLLTNKAPLIVPGLTELDRAEFLALSQGYREEVGSAIELVREIRKYGDVVDASLNRIAELPNRVGDRKTRTLLKQIWRLTELTNDRNAALKGLTTESMVQLEQRNFTWLMRMYEESETNDDFRATMRAAEQIFKATGRVRTNQGNVLIGQPRELEQRFDRLEAIAKQAAAVYQRMVGVVQLQIVDDARVREVADQIIAEITRLTEETRTTFEVQLQKLGDSAVMFRKNRDLLEQLPDGARLYSDYDSGVFHLRWKSAEFISTLFGAVFSNQADADQLTAFYGGLDFTQLTEEMALKLLETIRDSPDFSQVIAEAMLPAAVIARIDALLKEPVDIEQLAELLKRRSVFRTDGGEAFAQTFNETWTKNVALFAFDTLETISNAEKWNVFLAQPTWPVRYTGDAVLATLGELVELRDEILGEAPISTVEPNRRDIIATLTGNRNAATATEAIENWNASDAVRRAWARAVNMAIDFAYLSEVNMLEQVLKTIIRTINQTTPDRLLTIKPQLDARQLTLDDVALGFANWITREGNSAAEIWTFLGNLSSNAATGDIEPYLKFTDAVLDRLLAEFQPIRWSPDQFQSLKKMTKAYRPLIADQPAAWLTSRAETWNGPAVSGPLEDADRRALANRYADFVDMLTSSEELTPSQLYRFWQSTRALNWRSDETGQFDEFRMFMARISKLSQPMDTSVVFSIISVAISLLEQAEVSSRDGTLLRRRWQYLHFGVDSPLRTDYTARREITLSALNDIYLNIREDIGMISFTSGAMPVPTLAEQSLSVVVAEIEAFEKETLSHISPDGYAAVTALLAEYEVTAIPFGQYASRYPFSPLVYLVMGIVAAKTNTGGNGNNLFNTDEQVWEEVLAGRPAEFRSHWEHTRAAVQEIADSINIPAGESAAYTVIAENYNAFFSGITYLDDEGLPVPVHGDPLLLRPIWDTTTDLSLFIKQLWETLLTAPLLQDNPVLTRYLSVDQPDVQIYQWLAAALDTFQTAAKRAGSSRFFEHMQSAGIRDRGQIPDALTYFVRAFMFHLPPTATINMEEEIKGTGPFEILSRTKSHPFAKSLIRNLLPFTVSSR